MHEPELIVALNGERLPDELRAVVEEACRATHLRVVPWTAGSPMARPLLVISALAPGERRIDEPLVQLTTHEHPGLPLLLLCVDELVRPTVSLHQGRVTLLGYPLTAERVGARLRILLADHRGDSSSGTLRFGVGHPKALVHDQSTPRVYWGFVAAGGENPAEWAPLVDVAHDGQLSVLLNTGAPLAADHQQRARQALSKEGPDPQKESALQQAVGASAALVHLSDNEWLVHWPFPQFGLQLFSAARLPSAWSFSNALGRTENTLLRADAATEDVLVGLWGIPWPATAADEARLREAAVAGGPRVLDVLVELAERADKPAVGLVMELR